MSFGQEVRLVIPKDLLNTPPAVLDTRTVKPNGPPEPKPTSAELAEEAYRNTRNFSLSHPLIRQAINNK